MHYYYIINDISPEMYAFFTSSIFHALLFPEPVDENEWLQYFPKITDDAFEVYVPINNQCSIFIDDEPTHAHSKQKLNTACVVTLPLQMQRN